ncbi:site-2 protease family protein [Streptomyces monashensis]|uniref:Zinc metalloprotease n=1 Tax=Streptomyces monashensis TaxID=1678012 RepID=A0A1S2PXD7_9ACTN|nr:site-2 protease family protein [Streptomyces monashensis]OIJ98507.1 site-2 protease family protein [Streptomyces monashensis]
MGGTFSFGRLAGIRISVHWSVLVIFALIVFGLAEGRLPQAHPGSPAWAYWLTGVATAVVFLLSLLAHEISHMLVAHRRGVGGDEITLWLLGGAARLHGEAPTPAAELRIAGVGPLVSLLLGGLFVLFTWWAHALHGPVLVVEAMAWLAGINILLAVFNVLPAAPLDGGRLLRALVWWRTGDRLRATEAATGAGRALGWILVAVGLYESLTRAFAGGLWLLLIGWFMVAMATVEGSQAKLRELLRSVPVRQAMTPDPLTIPAGTTVRDFLSSPHWRYRHSAFPVTDPAGRPVGLIAVRRAAQVEERDSTSVEAVMTPFNDVPTAAPDDPLAQLLPALDTSPARRALVLADDRVVGIVTSSDVSRIITWLSTSPPGTGPGTGP